MTELTDHEYAFPTIPDSAVEKAAEYMATRGIQPGTIDFHIIRGALHAARPKLVREIVYARQQEAYNDGFENGVRIGRGEGASAELDTFAPIMSTEPSSYDAAVEALAATALVVTPFASSAISSDAVIGLAAARFLVGFTAVADGLHRWLSEHVDAEPDTGTIDGE
jgi:hypothetical protein